MATLHQPYDLKGGGQLVIAFDTGDRPLTEAELALAQRLAALVARSDVVGDSSP